MNEYMVCHDLQKVTGKQIVLVHIRGAVIPLAFGSLLQFHRFSQRHSVAKVRVVVDEDRLIVEIGRASRLFVRRTKVIGLLKPLKGDTPTHVQLHRPCLVYNKRCHINRRELFRHGC